ncbi:MAG: hypothetical protein JW738_05875 [Actinobacteria bacterium]|nr:hypothetical protein [Actinomycetota bacterium]
MNNNVYVPLFEYGTYVVCAVIGILLFTRYKSQRVYQWVYIAAMLSFPFEWFADNYWMYYNYHPGFNHMFGHFPLFLPFAWAWFFPLIVLGLMTQEKWLQKLPKPLSVLAVFLICFVWDFIVEVLACKVGIWVYWWPKSAFMPFTEVPVWIPVFTGLYSAGYYYVAKWAKERLADDPDVGWARGFFSTYWRFLAVGAVFGLVGFVFVNYIIGHDPTPYAPVWWVKSGLLVF